MDNLHVDANEKEQKLQLSPWMVTFGEKEAIVKQSRDLLEQFGVKLFQHVVNPDKVDKESVERILHAWQTSKEKYTHEDDLQMQKYMQKVHAPRIAKANRYVEYKQTLSEVLQELESASITEKAGKKRHYLTLIAKKDTEPLAYPFLYTTEP